MKDHATIHPSRTGIARTDNPALPCLIASAGFARSDWIDVTTDPVQIDILFGEVGGRLTSGPLPIEREGEHEETFWATWAAFVSDRVTTGLGIAWLNHC